MKSQINEDHTKKVIIIFDGHGVVKKEGASYSFKHYFLCDLDETLSSEDFNKWIIKLIQNKGVLDCSKLCTNDMAYKHFLGELTTHQKMYSHNLRKIKAHDPQDKYKFYELAKVFNYEGHEIKLKIQFTNFHPDTGIQLALVRSEEKELIQFSWLENLVFPMFTNDKTVLIESCGFPLDIEPVEAIGVWGACREEL